MTVRNKRRGLQRLECPECETAIYLTWAQAEGMQARGRLPLCVCDAVMEPVDFELALELGLDDAVAVGHYAQAVASISRGQAPAAMSEKLARRRAAKGTELESPHLLAAARVEQDRREVARRNQLAGLRVGTMTREAVNDAMPF